MSLTGLAFSAAFFGALAMALVRHPLWGLYAYMATFYLHPSSRWWGAGLPEVRWAFVAAGVTLVAMLLHRNIDGPRQSWLSTTPAKVLLAFAVWMWIQSLWALDIQEHGDATQLLTKYLLVFYMVFRLVNTTEKMTWFVLAHILGCLYLSWLGYTNADYSRRLDGVGGPGINDANTLSMHLGTAVVLGAMLILMLRGWRQIFCIAAMPLIMNAIVLAGSRGSFLGVVAGGCVLFYLKPARYRKLFYAFAALGVLLFGYVASESFWARMDTIAAAAQDEEVDSSAEARIELIKAQLRMLRECFPHGCGRRGTAALSRNYLDVEYLTSNEGPVEVYGARSSHNTFLSVLVEHGAPGTLLFSILLVWLMATIRKLKRLQRAAHATSDDFLMHAVALCGGWTVVLMAGLFTDYLMAEVQIWMLALLASLMQSAERTARYEAAAWTTPGLAPHRWHWRHRSRAQ